MTDINRVDPALAPTPPAEAPAQTPAASPRFQELLERMQKQKEHNWFKGHSGTLECKHLGIIGSGSIGQHIAKTAGYFQLILAVIGFIEVIRRFIGVEKMPDFSTMIIVSIFALTANGICLYLLQKSKSREAHMQASMIFTSNDVIINLGVIAAGLLVNWLNSSKPDLIIGAIVFVLVIRGAVKILKLGK